jgi:hypothetical protein
MALSTHFLTVNTVLTANPRIGVIVSILLHLIQALGVIESVIDEFHMVLHSVDGVVNCPFHHGDETCSRHVFDDLSFDLHTFQAVLEANICLTILFAGRFSAFV